MGVCKVSSTCQVGARTKSYSSSEKEFLILTKDFKQLAAKTRQLSQEPDEKLLSELRVLERKMGLVLTLVCRDPCVLTYHRVDLFLDHIYSVQSICLGSY